MQHYHWQVFKGYEVDEADDPDKLPEDDQEEINQWVVRWSSIVELNLAPMFELWFWPLSPDTYTRLADMSPFLPMDNITAREWVSVWILHV